MILPIINIVALILIPIVSVLLGHCLQNRAKKREDKIAIFKSLMTSRIYGWTVDSVHALNLIEVVFANDKKVIEQWENLHDKLFVESPTETELHKIKIEKDKLLKVMAKSLGYKIDFEVIQTPYMPSGLVDLLNNQQAFSNMQLEIMKKMTGTLSANSESNKS